MPNARNFSPVGPSKRLEDDQQDAVEPAEASESAPPARGGATPPPALLLPARTVRDVSAHNPKAAALSGPDGPAKFLKDIPDEAGAAGASERELAPGSAADASPPAPRRYRQVNEFGVDDRVSAGHVDSP